MTSVNPPVYPPAPLEAVERWIQGALRDLKRVSRHLLDAPPDRPAVHRPQRERFQDEKIERALRKIEPSFVIRHSAFGIRHS